MDERELRESTTIVEAASRSIVGPDGNQIELGYDGRGEYTGDGVFDAQGRVPLHIIRPGLGRGKGRHLYEASMLRENASKFAGWRMFVNHLAPEAKKALAGLPRHVEHLGGRITESWWSDDVPASDRHDRGAVIGMAKPTPQIRDLIDNDPELLEASISATATGVKPRDVQGGRAWVVEGIEDTGSVDWVTEAGAGGRVVSIIEAAMADDPDGHLTLLASMSDDEFTEHLRETRPELLESLGSSGGESDPNKGAEEHTMPEKTPTEVLQEALSSEEGRTALMEAVDFDEQIQEAVTDALEESLPQALSQVLSEALPGLLREALEEEREVIRATARADADRRVQITEMRSVAHETINATRLPDPFKADLRGRFDIVEGKPTPDLNVIDEVNDDGEVTKRAEDKLREAVTERIKHAQALYAAANPTRVTAQGPSGGDNEEEVTETAVPKGGLVEDLLQEAGFDEKARESLYG